MNQYNEISTLQYMGSKARIISHICDPIMKNKSIQTVVDLFAGTGSVGYALKSYKNVISNDIEYYAYIINQAILLIWILCPVKKVRTGEYTTNPFRFHAVKLHLMKL